MGRTRHLPPEDLVASLDVDAIEERLTAIARERRALLVLLRAARAAAKRGGERRVAGRKPVALLTTRATPPTDERQDRVRRVE